MSKVKLGDYIEAFGDGIHGTPVYDENGEYFFINGNNLIDGEITIDENTLRVSKTEYEKIKRPLGENTLLLSINGTLGRVAEYKNEKIALGKSACFLNIKDNVNKDFVRYVMLTQEFQKYILLVAHGSTIKNLAPSQVADYEFSIPSSLDINKMADLLKVIDNKIKNNKKINAELESMAKTIYDYWFLQFEFPNEDGKPYKSSGGKMVWNEELKREIPEGWECKTIKDIENNIITGKTPSSKVPEYYNGDIPFITIGDIRGNMYVVSTEQTLSEEGAKTQNNKFIPEGSICVTCIATPGLVGFSVKDSQTNQQINSIVPKNKKNSNYLYFAIDEYFEYASGAKTGNTFANMNKEDFSNILLLYNKEMVENYFDITKDIFDKIKQSLLENQELASLRDFLLPMLMNGQVGFKDGEK